MLKMRLIDADDLISEFEWLKSVTNEYSKDEIQEIIQRIENAPTVEAVVLPCKLGDPVFIIGGKYRAGRFEAWINSGKFRLSDLEKMGKTVFVTSEEAEAALAKLETAWGGRFFRSGAKMDK